MVDYALCKTCPAKGAVERYRCDAIVQGWKEGEGVRQWCARKCKRKRDARMKQVGDLFNTT